jgi:hypothetical protein
MMHPALKFLKMKYYLIIILMMYISISKSQTTFEYLLRSPLDEISRSMIEDAEGNIYFTVENFQFASIKKLDPFGNLIDSVEIYNPQGTCNLSELIRIDAGHFVVLGHWTTDTGSVLWYTKFNNDLNLILDNKIASYGIRLSGFKHIVRHNGNIVFSAQYTVSPTDWRICMYEITTDGDFVRNKFFVPTISFTNLASTLLEDTLHNNYKLFSMVPVASRSYLSSITYLDTVFNVTESILLNSGIVGDQNTAKWLNDSTYLLTSRRRDLVYFETDIGICKMTSDDSLLSAAYFGKPDTVDYAGLYNNLDFISHNNIFFAGESNIYAYYQNVPSWIMLNIVDSNLNLKSQHFYGGDVFYLVNSILATQDSGCVLSCSRYDHNIQDNEFDVYILKVNKDGLLVSTPETPEINRQLCTVYPNPGSEMVNVNSIKDGLQFQLLDLTGKLQLATSLGKGNNLLDASGLAAGIYLYRIMDKENQTVQTGKWLRAY